MIGLQFETFIMYFRYKITVFYVAARSICSEFLPYLHLNSKPPYSSKEEINMALQKYF